MKHIKEAIIWALRFVFVSSKDPNKWSLSVKMALLGLIPMAMQAVHIVCGLALICLAVDANVLESVALTVSNLVYLALSFIAGVGFLWGLCRKVFRTAQGTNVALTAAQVLQ